MPYVTISSYDDHYVVRSLTAQQVANLEAAARLDDHVARIYHVEDRVLAAWQRFIEASAAWHALWREMENHLLETHDLRTENAKLKKQLQELEK